jgi:hypothetical protein
VALVGLGVAGKGLAGVSRSSGEVRAVVVWEEEAAWTGR